MYAVYTFRSNYMQPWSIKYPPFNSLSKLSKTFDVPARQWKERTHYAQSDFIK